MQKEDWRGLGELCNTKPMVPSSRMSIKGRHHFTKARGIFVMLTKNICLMNALVTRDFLKFRFKVAGGGVPADPPPPV